MAGGGPATGLPSSWGQGLPWWLALSAQLGLFPICTMESLGPVPFLLLVPDILVFPDVYVATISPYCECL